METNQHPTYRFLLKRHQIEPGRPTFLIIGGMPLLAQLDETADDELQLFKLVVTEEGKPAAWRDDDFTGLEWRCADLLAATTAESLTWLENRSRKYDGGAFYITSSLDVDPDAGGATSMGKATSRGALELYGEWDDIPQDEQLQRIKTLQHMGLACHTVTSGGDSVHWHVPFDRLVAWDEAMPLLKRVTALMGSDVCCVSKARRMRLPGLYRKKGQTVTPQELLQLTDKTFSAEAVRIALDQGYTARSWSFSEKRWAMFRRNMRRQAAGIPLTNGWDTPGAAWTCSAEELLLYKCDREAQADSDGATLPPIWLRTEHHLGARVRKLQEALLDQHGLIGAYELALTHGTLAKQKLAADKETPFAFDFAVRNGSAAEAFPAEVCGHSPFSDTNHTGSSFVLFGGNRRWYCRKLNEGGQLAELLLYFCPGIHDPEEPSDREQKAFLLWLTKVAGQDVEKAAQQFEDGKYGDDMEAINAIVQDSLNAEGNPLETEAVNKRAEQMKLRLPQLYRLKMHYLAGTLRNSGSTDLDSCVSHPDNIDTPVVYGFLPRHHLAVTGPPSAGKTTFGGGFLAARILNGHDVVIDGKAHKTTAGRVLIISSDAGTDSIKKDMIKQGVDVDDPKIKARLRFLSDLTYNDMSLIVKTMQEFQPDLTFFDSFLSMKPPGVKLADDECAEPLRFLTRANGVIFPRHLLLTALHTQRANNRAYLGSTAIRAAVDSLCTYTEPDDREEGESGPLRILSFKGDEMKCRLGNRNRSWAVRYEELQGIWQITEIKREGPGSVTTQLRALIESRPFTAWLRMADLLRQVDAGEQFADKSAQKTAARHLQAMDDLIETRTVTNPRTKQPLIEYRVLPSVYSALMNTERGYVPHNIVGVRPVTAAAAAKAAAAAAAGAVEAGEAVEAPKTPAKGRKPAAGPQRAVPRKARKARAAVKPSCGSGKAAAAQKEVDLTGYVLDVGRVVDEQHLTPINLQKPPHHFAAMAVQVEGEWRNGWKFHSIDGEGLAVLYGRYQHQELQRARHVLRSFPSDASSVRVCLKHE